MKFSPGVASPQILLVEDDDAVRRGLLLLLRSRGYEVRAYPSAVGLAADPGALACSCLIADLVMPGTDAIQLLTQLHAASWRGSSILISGHLDPEWRSRATSAGYDAVLSKPISESVLVRTVDELLSHQRADRSSSDGAA